MPIIDDRSADTRVKSAINIFLGHRATRDVARPYKRLLDAGMTMTRAELAYLLANIAMALLGEEATELSHTRARNAVYYTAYDRYGTSFLEAMKLRDG